MDVNQIYSSTSTNITDIDINNIIQGLLLILTEREKDIIVKRYALGEERRYTLAYIGNKYNITRERVRQMEQVALEKLRRTAERTKLHIIGEFAHNIVMRKGFILSEQELISLVFNVVKNNPQIDKNYINLAINLERRLYKVNNTIKYLPYWRTVDIDESEIKDISDKIYKILKNSENSLMEIDEVSKFLNKSFPKFDINTFKSIFSLDKSLKLVGNSVGLATDKKINPKTLRDKIFFVLRKEARPMHFVEIANSIIKEGFDRKHINKQAVHNECIRHDSFVLIGRGIYALKEWGYKNGTVKEIIFDILKDGKARSREQILEAVKKQRMVKDVTILLSLKVPEIKRVGREQYKLMK